MRASSYLPWSVTGAPREDYRDIVMIAGKDPYAWKGTEEVMFPYVRADSPEAARTLYAELKAEGDRRRVLRAAAA